MGKKRNRLYVISLGCPKNLVDTEIMLGRLIPRGYQLEADPLKADALLINTCSFIESARQESLDTIRECVEYKRQGRARAIVVTGCMPESHLALLQEEFPDLMAFLNLKAETAIVETLDRLLARQTPKKRKTPPALRSRSESTQMVVYPDRYILTQPHTAYLRIADGCDHTCSFCIIPLIRDHHQSVPLEEVVAEAEKLAASGVRELNLISQDTTAYGRDTTGNHLLPALLEKLNRISGISWIRILYAYPSEISNELIDAIADLDKVVPYLDLPLQHASEKILKAMKRPASHRYLEGLVERLKTKIPDLSLRSTFIVGFPGETDRDFQKLYDFCKEMQFDHAGCFIYSHEELSRAAHLPHPVPRKIQEERQQILVQLLNEIGEQKTAERVNTITEVLVDDESSLYPDYCRGRHSGQAPDIDGVVYVPFDDAGPGDLLTCRLTAHQGYDLFAEAL